MKTLKSVISVLLAIAIVFAAVMSVGALTEYVRGDADGNGAVTAVDVTVIQRHIVGIETKSFVKIAADVDGKGLSIVDASAIQRYLVGLGNPYNIGETFTYDEYELPVV